MSQFEIKEIGNYYGTLQVEVKDGEYFWGIEDWCCDQRFPIPDYLYSALRKYHEEQKETK